MTTFTTMEDIQLMSEDWQLEPSLGLTLFDDPWKAVELESAELKNVEEATSNYDISDLLCMPQTDLADSFCADWMENADVTEMLQNLVQESEDLQTVDLVELSLPEQGNNVTEVKSSDILRNLIEQSTEAVIPSEVQVCPTISLTRDNSFEDEPMSSTIEMDDIMQSPLSADDVDSLLSGSEPSSPRSSDCEKSCSELEAMLLDRTPVSLSKHKPRSAPYTKGGRSVKSKVKAGVISDGSGEYLSKKDKKKLQNKNAAIRYRQKKKQEAEVVKDEESVLEDVNKGLQDKVDQLSREIQYMKDLMAEVYKAQDKSRPKVA